ncbi:atrial natriuretic peptide receptor 2-like [Paramacrobiotus metropolitanus]|uniref:atrial natriuretic peptide receptor 2-like n=1 Tax=Paramacrobiotus metropolitanus TaxID=2943436 RepID=UPI00244586C6|nr:atrial natriuretic peptide receptor 2-like [Paramacrobiotus metropolitanus]
MPSNDTDLIILTAAFRVLFVMTIKVPYSQASLENFNNQTTITVGSDYIQQLLHDRDVARKSLLDNSKLYNIVDFEALSALATILDEAVARNISLMDGRRIARLFYNRTFQSDYSQFYVDSYGRRLTPMVMKDFNATTGIFEDAIFGDIVKDVYHISVDKEIDWGPSQLIAPPDEPLCGFLNNKRTCQSSDNVTLIAVAVIVGLAVSLLLFTTAGVYYGRQAARNKHWWILDAGNLTLYNDFSTTITDSSTKRSHSSIAQFSGTRVHLYKVESTIILATMRSANISFLLNMMKDLANCSSINRFMGICRLDEQQIVFVSTYCDKHSLLVALTQNTYVVDSLMQVSFIWDLLQGIEAIHSSSIAYHGTLSITSCCVDKYFTLKICKLGYDRLLKEIKTAEHNATNRKSQKRHSRWEIGTDDHQQAAQRSDIFNAGLILAQILGQASWIKEAGSIPEKVNAPVDTLETRYPLQELIQNCLQQDGRPGIKTLINNYSKIVGARPKQMAEMIVQRLSRYNDALEAAVRERIVDLRRQQLIADEMLTQLMPLSIVRQLRAGLGVSPEYYDSASVCFTSFDGFMEFVQQSPPVALIEFLNEMVVVFEKTIAQYDVYRVEVVADTHMVLAKVRRFTVTLLQFLFRLLVAYPTEITVTMLPKVGDTINCASRMASSGRGTCLQVSVDTQQL